MLRPKLLFVNFLFLKTVFCLYFFDFSFESFKYAKILLEKQTNGLGWLVWGGPSREASREAPPESPLQEPLEAPSPSQEPLGAPPESLSPKSLSPQNLSGEASQEPLRKPLPRASWEAPPESLSGSPSREPQRLAPDLFSRMTLPRESLRVRNSILKRA